MADGVEKKPDRTVGWYELKDSQRVSLGKIVLTIMCEDCGEPQEVYLWSFAGCGKRCDECGKVIAYRKRLELPQK